MKKLKITFFFICFTLYITNMSFADSNSITDIKEKAIALYETQNYNDAQIMLEKLPANEKDENVFLILSNIAREKGDDNLAIRNLNKALDKDYKFYKAYYNLGCIFADKKSYLLAINNFDLAIKYNKENADSYYNLACCQIKLKNYEQAKKNLIKAIELNSQNKDYYYNLAFCYKELNKIKQAQKILDTYNKMS